jgi:hypothetical protein
MRIPGPLSRSGEVRNISPPLAFDHRTVQTVASPYTDHAIPAYDIQINMESNWYFKIQCLFCSYLEHDRFIAKKACSVLLDTYQELP